VRKKSLRPKASARKSLKRVRRPAPRSGRQKREAFGPTGAQPAPSDVDSQGLSNAESADSESVSELIDEGNTFEAGVVSGVQQADDADERPVRTREFPEDDVPEEYLDKD